MGPRYEKWSSVTKASFHTKCWWSLPKKNTFLSLKNQSSSFVPILSFQEFLLPFAIINVLGLIGYVSMLVPPFHTWITSCPPIMWWRRLFGGVHRVHIVIFAWPLPCGIVYPQWRMLHYLGVCQLFLMLNPSIMVGVVTWSWHKE